MKIRILTAIALVCISLFAFSSCSKHEPQMKGKFLKVALLDNVRTSDPTNAYDMVSSEVAYQVYETPYQYDYYSDEVKVIPELADGMPTVSKDGKTVTFKIKKGLRYQDDPCFKETNGKGREVKAQDFLYSWKRHANPANESQGFWIWEGKVLGMDDFQKKFGSGKSADEVMSESVAGMQALDDYTLQLKLTKPYPQLLYILTTTFTSPVPHEAVSFYGKDFVNHPVGTGPFKAQVYEPTSRIVLVKNENYRDDFFPAAKNLGKKFKQFAAYSGKKLPLIDGIVFDVVKEEQPRWLNFLSGKYDQIKIPKDNFSQAIVQTPKGPDVSEDLKKKGVYLSTDPAIAIRYVGLTVRDPVLGSNKYLRQAIASAIDAKGWLEKFMNNRGEVQTEVNPPIVPDRCGKPYRWTFNLERAKQLLAKAGYPNGKGLPTLHWDTRGTEMTKRQIAEFMQMNLAKIGIKLEVNANTFPIYLDKSHKGNLQISEGGWTMDYPDAENNYQLLYGPNQPPGPNEVVFDNAEYNKLYEKMALMPSGPERKKIVCKMEDIIQEEVPWAYGYYENEYRLAQGWLKNFHTSELIYQKWKYVDIDTNAKQEMVRN